jgi:ribosomal protein S6
MKNGTKYYEFSYLLPPTISHEEALSLEESFRSLLGSFEAVLDSWDSPKRRNLAYSIANGREAYLGALRFTATPNAAVELKEKLRENKSLTRFMVLEWKKALPPRRKPIMPRPADQVTTETPVEPTDEKVIDEKLDEILGIDL